MLKISQTAAVDIEQLVSRSDCYNRVYSSSVSCTGKFDFKFKETQEFIAL